MQKNSEPVDPAQGWSRGVTFQHVPRDGWLLALLDGWRLPFVVQL